MKKILAFLLIMFLMSCEIEVKPREVDASSVCPTFSGSREIRFETYETNGMTYGIFFSTQQTSESGNGVCVVNLTKDELEVEKLKFEIKKFKK